jgi:hypothetical protein
MATGILERLKRFLGACKKLKIFIIIPQLSADDRKECGDFCCMNRIFVHCRGNVNTSI